MDLEPFTGKIGELSSEVKQNFGTLNLTENELQLAMVNTDEFIRLISEKSGVPKEDVAAKVHQVMEKLHIEESSRLTPKFGEKVTAKFNEIKDRFSH